MGTSKKVWFMLNFSCVIKTPSHGLKCVNDIGESSKLSSIVIVTGLKLAVFWLE